MNECNRILITCRQMQLELPVHADRMRAAGYEPIAPEIPGQQFDTHQLIELLDSCVGVIAGDDLFTAAVFEAHPQFRVLVKWGIGMDAIDLAAAAASGVLVENTPAVFGEEVADSAFGYLLALARGHHRIDGAVRGGGWPKFEGTSLFGAQLGIVGHGSIGRATSRRGLGFGMEVRAFDPYVSEGSQESGVVLTDLESLLKASQFIVLTCPLTAETHHLLNSERLGWMRDDSYLVNVARGSVIDELALISELDAGRFAGVGLDVFEIEPLPADSPLREHPRVMLGAHNGSNTREGVRRASAVAVERLLDLLTSSRQGVEA